MDYGQITQVEKPENEQLFFTAGAGSESTDVNNFEPENNIDLTNTEASWGNTERADLHGIGSNTIGSINEEQSRLPESSSQRDRTRELIPNPNSDLRNEPFPVAPKLGEIVSTMPPGHTETDTGAPNDKPTVSVLFTSDTMMEGDKLSKQAIDILQQEEKELYSSGDISAFVDKIDDYREQFQGRQTA